MLYGFNIIMIFYSI